MVNREVTHDVNTRTSKLLLDVIQGRRSVRSYKDQQVPESILMAILGAGQWAPSGSDVQSWRFVVIQEPQNLEILKALSPGFPREAPVAITVCSDQQDMESIPEAIRPLEDAENVAMAVQNMLLVAHSLGLGACAVGSFSVRGIIELLELPDYIRPILLVSLGFPAGHSTPPKRKELSRIVFWERYIQES
jgi:nitroreductase